MKTIYYIVDNRKDEFEDLKGWQKGLFLLVGVPAITLLIWCILIIML